MLGWIGSLEETMSEEFGEEERKRQRERYCIAMEKGKKVVNQSRFRGYSSTKRGHVDYMTEGNKWGTLTPMDDG